MYIKQDEDCYGDVQDIDFYHIKTNKGVITVDMRTDHNGYYGGNLEFVGFKPHGIDDGSEPAKSHRNSARELERERIKEIDAQLREGWANEHPLNPWNDAVKTVGPFKFYWF